MEIPLILSGCYFMILGIWWTTQTVKFFTHFKQRRLEFKSSVTFPCCRKFHKLPLEGILKFIFCCGMILFCIASASDFSFGSKIKHFSDLSHATIFLFFTISSIIDIIKYVRGKLFIEGLDYAALSLTFAVQGILYGFHVPDAHAEEWTVYNLLMISAFSCCIATILELRTNNQVFYPLIRSFTTIAMGTWLLHSAIILSQPLATSTEDAHRRVITLSIYYCWHLALDFGILISVWLVTQKLMTLNRCCCVPSELDPNGDVVFLENRIRFDYHIIDRMDSDVD